MHGQQNIKIFAEVYTLFTSVIIGKQGILKKIYFGGS